MHRKQNVFLFLATLLLATSSTAMEEDLLRSDKPLKLTLEESIPEGREKEKIVSFLKATSPKTAVENDLKKVFGYSFPPSSPWGLLVIKYMQSQPWKECPNVGDWGCGHGFFSRHAVLAGANLWALEFSKAAATEANKNIWVVKQFIPASLLKDLYRVFSHSVTDPGPDFMARQNHINVAFNVIHYLAPADADKFLENLYQNTAPNGLVFLSADMPYDPDSKGNEMSFYNEGKAQGVKYPGYGVYSMSRIEFLGGEGELSWNRGVLPVTKEEEASEAFSMGERYLGLYRRDAAHAYDDGQTIEVHEPFSPRDILGELSGNAAPPYRYATKHYTYNKFDYEGLARVLELVGFSVVNGWHIDNCTDTLYPIHTPKPPLRKQRIVVAAQKPMGAVN